MDDARKRGPIRSFRDIEAYQRGRALQPVIYKIAAAFPDIEKFDLADQMRRACKSVVTNIAEGYAKRDSVAEFKRFLRISMGSANEMEVHLETAGELGYITRAESARLIAEYQIIWEAIASSHRELAEVRIHFADNATFRLDTTRKAPGATKRQSIITIQSVRHRSSIQRPASSFCPEGQR